MKPEMRQGKKGQSQATDSCTCKQDRRKAPRMSKEDREKMRQEMKASRESYEAGLKKIMTKTSMLLIPRSRPSGSREEEAEDKLQR